MDLALIAIIISIVVLVFQIVTLVLIAGMKKSLGSIKATPAPSVERDRSERRDNEVRRHERRPYQDNRPRQQSQQQPAPAAAGESVDKSLRDINLRLKNAERDQENARRRIQQGGFSQDQQRSNRDRGDRFDRGDRGHRGNRDHRGSRHDRHRDRGRGNWQDRDRNRQGGPYGQQQQQGAPAPAAATEGEPLFEKKDIVSPDMQANPATEAPAAVAPDIAPADYSSDESLEHGRKIIVKRRMLQGEPSEASADVPAEPQNTVESAPAPSAVSGSEEETAMSGQEGEIMFGRRKAL